MKIKVLIAMHKPYEIPEDPLYLPIFVGAKGKKPLFDGITGDDTGEEISEKNGAYCELTGWYWAWKNLEADVIGLVHYRRYFTKKSRWFCRNHSRMECVLTEEEATELLLHSDIVVPNKRRYYIETLYSHYGHTHDSRHLDRTRELIEKRCPEYLLSLDRVYRRTWGYMFNMCIMKRDELDGYCSWLFPLLFALEESIGQEDQETQSAFDARFYGRVSEILFNVWLEYRRQEEPGLRIREVRTMHMEPINWWRKGGAFLRAKFFGKKYSKSF